MKAFIVIALLLFLGFIFFCIYFIFKQMQFVIQAINLYKDMVTRQDMMIKLLKDVRGGDISNNRNDSNLIENKDEEKLKIEAEKQAKLDNQLLLQAKKDYKQGNCPECGEEIDKKLIKCLACGADLSSFE